LLILLPDLESITFASHRFSLNTSGHSYQLPLNKKIGGYLYEIQNNDTKGALALQGREHVSDCSVCLHPARDVIEQRILSGEPLTQILDDYHQGVYHAPVYPGDRGWYERHPLDGNANRSLPLFYHKVVCMEGRCWSEYQHPTNGDKPLKDIKNSWRFIVKEKYKNIHNDIQRARYKRICAGWNGIFKHQVLDGSLALPLTENVHIEKLKQPRPNIGRWAGKCDILNAHGKKCKADCYENHLGNVICSRCGWIKEDPGRILDNPIKYNNGRTGPTGGSEWVAISSDLNYKVETGYGSGGDGRSRPLYYPKDITDIPRQSFKGEAYLTTPGKGAAATTREDKQIRHFCDKHGSYLARPIWWTNPDNDNGKYWFCLKCQKAAGVVDFPQKWVDEDLAILKALGYESGVWYAKISRYLKDQKNKSEKQIDPITHESLFHYQKALESNRYLKTAILTMQLIRIRGEYTRMAATNPRPKPKGGRKANGGAKAVRKWCARARFIKAIPGKEHRADKDNLRYGVILQSFKDQAIEPILKELDDRNIKYGFRYLKSISDMGVYF